MSKEFLSKEDVKQAFYVAGKINVFEDMIELLCWELNRRLADKQKAPSNSMALDDLVDDIKQ